MWTYPDYSHYTLAGGGVILREAVTQRGAGGRLCLPVGGHRALTPGPGSFGCNGLEELSQVGYITVRAVLLDTLKFKTL